MFVNKAFEYLFNFSCDAPFIGIALLSGVHLFTLLFWPGKSRLFYSLRIFLFRNWFTCGCCIFDLYIIFLFVFWRQILGSILLLFYFRRILKAFYITALQQNRNDITGCSLTASLEPLVSSNRMQVTILPGPFAFGAKNTYHPSFILSLFQILSGVPVLPATAIPNLAVLFALCFLI